jgi:hypothetical protein
MVASAMVQLMMMMMMMMMMVVVVVGCVAGRLDQAGGLSRLSEQQTRERNGWRGMAARDADPNPEPGDDDRGGREGRGNIHAISRLIGLASGICTIGSIRHG